MSKNSGAAAFMRNSYQLYKEDLTRECNKKFREKNGKKKIHQTYFYNEKINLIWKSIRKTTEKGSSKREIDRDTDIDGGGVKES